MKVSSMNHLPNSSFGNNELSPEEKKYNIHTVPAKRWVTMNDAKPNRESRRAMWCHRQRGSLTSAEVQKHNGTVAKPASLSKLVRKLFQHIAKIANKKKKKQK